MNIIQHHLWVWKVDKFYIPWAFFVITKIWTLHGTDPEMGYIVFSYKNKVFRCYKVFKKY